MLRHPFAAMLVAIFASSGGASAMTINLNANATLAGNAPALAAFQRAAVGWQNLFSDNITVQIDAGLAVLGPGIIGSAGSTLLQAGYNTIRNGMIADAADEASNAIVGFLPTAPPGGTFSAIGRVGDTLSSSPVLTQANAKALGLVNPITGFAGDPDAEITFSSTFVFDFDNSDGVTPGAIDFETVASHEIGHALGFISGVDATDGTAPHLIFFTTLDFFRFSSNLIPTTNAQFSTNARYLAPGDGPGGAGVFFSDTVNAWRFSTGLTQGDGNQASHWKDDALTGTYIGMMDPTLSSGVLQLVTLADIRALDLIGYDVAIPEPATVALVGGALLIAVVYRRRKHA